MTKAIELSQLGSVLGVDGGTGNVGIGTANPLQKLHIVDPTSANIYVETKNSTTGSTAGVFFRTSDGTTENGFFKTGVILEDDGTTFARGKLHILQENTADSSNATIANSVVTINQSGNVGINRTNPDQRLNVNGNIEVNAYDSASGSGGYYTAKGLIIGNLYDAGKSYTGSDDRTACIWQERGLDLDFATNNALRLKITYDGNIGIGTTNVTRKLTIYNGSSDSDIIAMSNDNVGLNLGAWGTGHSSYDREVTINGTRFDNGSAPQLRIGGQGGIKFCVDLNTERFTINSSGVKQVKNGNLNIYQTYIDFSGDQSSTPQTAAALYRPADGRFAISTQNTERFRVSNTGKVRVGTGDASYNFEVQGSGNQSMLVGSTNAAGAALIIDGDSNGDGAGTDYASLTHDTSGHFQINNRKNGSIIFKAGANETEWVRIKHDGNVGIGTNSPNKRFSIQGTDDNFIELRHATRSGIHYIAHSGTGSETLAFFQNNGTNTNAYARFGRSMTEFYRASGASDNSVFYINGVGNVGIGTNNPLTLLDVRGGNEGAVTVGTTSQVYGRLYGSSTLTFVGAYNGADLSFSTSSSTSYSSKMMIKNGGNVGIATDNPAEKLDVYGSIRSLETGPGNGLLLHTNSGLTASANLMQIWTGQSSGISFHTNSGSGDGSNERFRIDGSGDVTIHGNVVIDGTDLYYTNSYNTNGWGNSGNWYTVVPNTMANNSTYLVVFVWDWNGSTGQPYYLTGQMMYTTTNGTNGTGVSAVENAGPHSAHTGSSSFLIDTRIKANNSGNEELQVRLSGFSSGTNSTIKVKVWRMVYKARS